MGSSNVYWMDAHSESMETSLVSKMLTVIDAANLDKMVKPNDMFAIKIHRGEWNNTAFVRPVYARALADRVTELGGRPFVCDTTTSTCSPWGSRSSELDILLTAEHNGYSSATLGCPFICADGFIGASDFRVDLPERCLLNEAYVAQAIAAADVLIALTRREGHIMDGHPNNGLRAAAEFHPEAAGKVSHIASGATWQLRGFYEIMRAPAAEATYRETPGLTDWYDTQDSQSRSYEHYSDQMRAIVHAMMAES